MEKAFYLKISILFVVMIFATLTFCSIFNSTNLIVFGEPENNENEVTTYTIEYYNTANSPATLIDDLDNPTTITSNDSYVTISANPQAPVGYKFKCWGDKNSTPLTYDTDAEKFILTWGKATDFQVNGVVKIYAFWSLINYNLSFQYNVDRVSNPSTLSTTVTIKSNIDLTLDGNKPIKLGYNFVGWFTDNAYTAPITILQNISQDTTLYGKFEKQDLVIHFASGEFDDIHFDYNDNAYGKDGILTDKVPNKSGYIFQGWYTTSDCKDGTKIGQKAYLQTSLTLYAKWQKNTAPIWWGIFGAIGGASIVVLGVWYCVTRPKLVDY